ncbi:MAG: hypothetical protein KDC48_20855, partial [Planctomycetes bacterium]|nr:hypothetical protein [Planctomycetota bacterium]
MTRHLPKRLLALSALGGMLAACGSAPVDVPPPPGSEPVPPAVVDSPPPAEGAAPRLPDRSWLADEGPIFDWRAEGVIGSADTASAPADTASAPAEAAASAAVEAPDAAVPTGS